MTDIVTKSTRRHPAEWEPHEAVWVAWPSHAELWEETLPKAQAEFTALCRAIAAPARPDLPAPERLEVLVPSASAQATAEAALAGLNARFHSIGFGDIWLRDTGPLFLQDEKGLLAASFRFNGWGEKYVLPHDDQVAARIVAEGDFRKAPVSWILEGGSIDTDGEGTCLTTRQCLLNPNRNAAVTEPEMETRLRESLGYEKVLWLDEGLLNDHTDGHIDTLARFVRPGVVACMISPDLTDPNYETLKQIAHDISLMTDAKGRKLEVITVPSPGRVADEKGFVLPASYMNFYIANQSILVPTYGSPHDEEAVSAIARIFPERLTVGLSARAILEGGGAFHCITQQQPALAREGKR